MAFSSNLGTIYVNDPVTGNWKPVKKLWTKTSTGWQPVQKAWTKIGVDTWEQIYPTPAATLTTNVASLTFNVYQHHSATAQPIIITNTGNNTLTITNATISISSYYGSILTPDSSYPMTILPGQSKSILVNVTGSLIGSDTSNAIVITADVAPYGTSTLTIPLTVNVLAEYSAISFENSITPVISKTVPLSMYYGDSLPSATITLYNNGNGKTVNISSVTSSSGVINVSSFPSAINSGNTGSVILTATSQAVGTHNDTITIISNDTSNPTLTITVNYTVSAKLPSISVSPPSLSAAYYDTDATGPTQTVTILNKGQATLTISSILSASSGSIAAVSGLTISSIAAGGTATFNVTGQPLLANATDTITINNNDTTNASIQIKVSYTVTVKQAGIQVYPSTVTPAATAIVTALSNWTLGINNIPKAQAMIIKNTSTGLAAKNLSITSINSSQGKCSFLGPNSTALAFPITITPGQTFAVSVQLGDDYVTTGQQQIDTIIINSNTTTPTVSTLAVPVYYTYIPKYPNIFVYLDGSPGVALTAIDLGTIYAGDTPTVRTVYIKNTELSAASLNVTGISSFAGYTSTLGITTPVSITSGAVKSFQLTFAGWSSLTASSNNYTDTINIVSDDPDSGTYQIALKGLVQNKQGHIKLDKTSYSLVFDVDDSTPPTTQVILTNDGNKTLNITGLSSTNSNFTLVSPPSLPKSLGIGSSVTLTLKAVSVSDVGKYTDYLKIVSDASNANNGLYQVPVTVIAKQPAATHTFTYNSSAYTLTLPYSVIGLKLLVTGAGGGGGSATESGNGGGGGGGGAGAIWGKVTSNIPSYNYAGDKTTVIPKNTNITVIIGKGGTALAASSSTRGKSANPGGFSKVVIPAPTAITVEVNGGLGGIGATPTSGGTGGTGGSISVPKGLYGSAGINGLAGQTGTADNSSSAGGSGGSGYIIKFAAGTIVHSTIYPAGNAYTLGDFYEQYSGLGGYGANSADRTSPYEFTGADGENGFVAISWDAYTPP
jgi:hypothetical protein